MNILLIQPKSYAIGFTDMILAEPLGLEAIAGSLTNHEIRILDLRLKKNLESEIRHFKPDVCGISLSYTIDHNPVVCIAKRIKELSPKTLVIVGGQHASFNTESLALADVDAVVLGEGEKTFAELIESIARGEDPITVRGLALKENEKFIFTGERKPEKDMDLLPLPRRDLLDRKYYHLGFQRPLALVETSRGCNHECSFCCVWQFYGRTVKSRTPKKVVEELERVREPYVLFVDDNFLVNTRRAEKIASLIRESGIKKRYTFQARSDTIAKNPDLIKLWKDVGLKGVFIGFEKIEDEELDALRKKTNVELNDRALEILRNLNIDVWASFIVDPSYDKKDFRKISDYVISRGIRTPTFSILTPLPGTKLYEELKEKIVSFDFDLFDIAHSVLPTKLPLEDFYREFCGLYKVPYSRFKLIMEGVWAYLTKGFKLSQLMRMLYSAKRLSDYRYYISAHRGRKRK